MVRKMCDAVNNNNKGLEKGLLLWYPKSWRLISLASILLLHPMPKQIIHSSSNYYCSIIHPPDFFASSIDLASRLTN